LHRYREVAQILTGNPEAEAADGERWVEELTTHLGVPSLATYGIGPVDISSLVEKAKASSSMKGNPIALTPAEMTEILERAL
jgi:alcohol dehydrogenase class IV